MAAPSEPQSPARRSLGTGHPAPLSARLVVLAASGLLPLAIVVALALAYLSGERQLATQRSAVALSTVTALRPAAGAVDSTASERSLLSATPCTPTRRARRAAIVRRAWLSHSRPHPLGGATGPLPQPQ